MTLLKNLQKYLEHNLQQMDAGKLNDPADFEMVLQRILNEVDELTGIERRAINDEEGM